MASTIKLRVGREPAWMVAFALVCAAIPAHGQAQSDAMIVLDASGSMRAQIQAESKLAIAKRVLIGILQDAPADRRLGLMAYGHRREKDCKDIAQIAAPGAARTSIAKAVARIQAKGKTPMSAAIEAAAQKLKYRNRPATVILISDGIETCAPDPCAAAAALERAGIDLTVHVIGFDLKDDNERAQLRCIAENTGGKFFSSSNSRELSEALKSAVVANAPAKDAGLSLRATELAGGLLITSGLSWTVRPARGGEPVFSQTNAGAVEAALAPGRYHVQVTRPADGLQGEARDVLLPAHVAKSVTIPLDVDFSATVTPDPSATVAAGAYVRARWTGPNRRGDFIAIAKAGAEPGAYATHTFLADGDLVRIETPLEPGNYELRYVLGVPFRVLARSELILQPVEASLEIMREAPAGSAVPVKWTGPDTKFDRIVLVVPDPNDPDRGKWVADGFVAGHNPLRLTMPLTPGNYELRYLQHGNKILARAPITLTAVTASLEAAAVAGAGAIVPVTWTGPDSKFDRIVVVVPDPNEPDRGKWVANGFVAGHNPLRIEMPLTPGNYELRYLQHGNKILARAPITVTGVTASLAGPAQGSAGAIVPVNWTGPDSKFDRIAVVVPEPSDPDRGKWVADGFVAGHNPLRIELPLTPGNYELRYLQHGNKILARAPITVTGVTATLQAPAESSAGAVMMVTWTGPNTKFDRIAMVTPDPNDPDRGKWVADRFINNNPLKFKLPQTPGSYELRYMQRGAKILARLPVTVVP